ncbi:MAG TPA: sulfite exporter TauE/SafE family protein [Thermoplasmata archaeon]|nr:sulfite exporter TauE/SafE family protein [Thermoplasmata archaeon]
MVRLWGTVDLALFVVLLVLVAIAAGLVGSLTGLGGGVVVIPILAIFFGASIPIAIGTGFVTILATSSATGAAYVRDRLSDIRIGMFLEIATVPGALIGATATVLITHANLDAALFVALGVVLFAIIPGSLARRNIELPPPMPQDARSRHLGLTGEYHDPALNTDVSYQAARTSPAIGVMFGAGMVSGMFGIGGGVFKVLALERFLNLPMKVATATSNFMIGVTAAAGAGVMLAAGYVNPIVAAPVAIGTAFGAFLGSRLLPGLRNRTVRLLFLPVIAALAIEMILRGLGLP